MDQARLNKIHTRMAAVGVSALIMTGGFCAGQQYADRYDIPANPVPECVTVHGTSQPTCYINDQHGAGTVIVTDYGRWNYELNTGDVIRQTDTSE